MKFRKTKCEACKYAMNRKFEGDRLILMCFHPALLSRKESVSVKASISGRTPVQNFFSPYPCPRENEKDVLRWYRSLTARNEILGRDLPEDNL